MTAAIAGTLASPVAAFIAATRAASLASAAPSWCIFIVPCIGDGGTSGDGSAAPS